LLQEQFKDHALAFVQVRKSLIRNGIALCYAIGRGAGVFAFAKLCSLLDSGSQVYHQGRYNPGKERAGSGVSCSFRDTVRASPRFHHPSPRKESDSAKHYRLFYEVGDDYLERRGEFRNAHLELAW
jgi:hypothetical protein